jgi:hypothetical protein
MEHQQIYNFSEGDVLFLLAPNQYPLTLIRHAKRNISSKALGKFDDFLELLPISANINKAPNVDTFSEAQRILEYRILQFKLKRIQLDYYVEDDRRNCLFYSTSLALYDTLSKAEFIRSEVSKWLRGNREWKFVNIKFQF